MNAAILKLAHKNVKILIKQKNVPTFESDDETFTLNLKFTNNALRMNLVPHAASVQIKQKEQTEEEKTMENRLEQQRSMQLDIRIIQIMKTRKEVRHTTLIENVMEMMTMFKAQPAAIKKRIEELIGKQYIKRDDKDRALYIYLP